MSEHEQIIVNKLDHLKELFELRFDQNEQAHLDMNSHLSNLNGKVAKHEKLWSENKENLGEIPVNTRFRLRSKVYAVVAIGLLGVVIPIIQYVVTKAIDILVVT